MLKLKKISMAVLALIILVGGTGISVQPAQAATCTLWHTVRAGETLYWIGRYYGVSWTTIAAINHLANPSLIYVGQSLCISTTGSGTPSSTGRGRGWDFSVVNVVKDTNVSVRTYNFPDNVLFEVYIGRLNAGVYEWKKVADLDSGRGGRFKAVFNIPADFAGVARLAVKITQPKKSLSVIRWFHNIPGGSGTGGPGPGYWGIPTIWIVSVVRNTSVTIRTNNFPAGLTFDVLMGPMGTRGIGGYYVGSFNSGAGGVMTVTFNIPPELAGRYQIAIRTQNLATGYYSYNWFYNNTTY